MCLKDIDFFIRDLFLYNTENNYINVKYKFHFLNKHLYISVSYMGVEFNPFLKSRNAQKCIGKRNIGGYGLLALKKEIDAGIISRNVFYYKDRHNIIGACIDMKRAINDLVYIPVCTLAPIKGEYNLEIENTSFDNEIYVTLFEYLYNNGITEDILFEGELYRTAYIGHSVFFKEMLFNIIDHAEQREKLSVKVETDDNVLKVSCDMPLNLLNNVLEALKLRHGEELDISNDKISLTKIIIQNKIHESM